MKKLFPLFKKFLLDILFPRFCLNCQKEGSYLCQDCFSLIDIFQRQYCPFCLRPKVVDDGRTCASCEKTKKLSGLYCAASYDNFIVKRLVNQFKYEPYIKELAEPLVSLIIAHINSIDKQDFNEFVLIPIPLHKKRLRRRGFNQAEEIAKELSRKLNIPVFNNILIKIKKTPPQVELNKKEREENILGSFIYQSSELIKNRKILLVDDVFTTGSTMEECAKVLKKDGAKEIWGAVIARG